MTAAPMTAAPSAVDDQIERANATGVYSSFATNRRQENTMALVRSGLRDAEPLQPGDGSTPGLVTWGQSGARQNSFELTDDVAGEIGFMYWHAGARSEHLVEHALERGCEIKRKPAERETAEPEPAWPFDHEKHDAKNASFLRQHFRQTQRRAPKSA